MLNDEDFARLKPTLYAGRYNLLTGAGVSMDSTGMSGKPLESGTALAKLLCNLKGVKESTPLAKVAQLLSPAEIDEHLTRRFHGCKPGKTVTQISNFNWRQLFTVNIDDALESAYERNPLRKQSSAPVNFNDAFISQPNRHLLQIVHLHGFTRRAEHGYVFSLNEYGNVTRGLNPWMHILSQLLVSEPFIIAGASLNESDLEYYLAGRGKFNPRNDKSPSILVEPYPDAITRKECERHGLILVEAKFNDFLEWVVSKAGPPPTLAQLIIPTEQDVFSPAPDKLSQISFYTSFDLIRPIEVQNIDTSFSPFYYGRPASWMDLAANLDVPVDDEHRIASYIKEFLQREDAKSSALVLMGEPGAGKTTCTRRVALDLAKDGQLVFALKTHAQIDSAAVRTCLAVVRRRFVLLVDGCADHASLVRLLLSAEELTIPFLILTTERTYREEHIDRVIGDLEVHSLEASNWELSDHHQLVERYRQNGLLAAHSAIRDPGRFAEGLRNDVPAIAVCRILNDFKPIDAIVKSLWNHSDEPGRMSYLIAAIANRCYPEGLDYYILQAAYDNPNLNNQLSFSSSLGLAWATETEDYVIPLNAMFADRILGIASRERRPKLIEAFINLGNAIAPYVNRQAIIDQTPEAKIAGSLFDSDRVARPLLGGDAEAFYVGTKDRWEWNSRYWEQRALLIQDKDLQTAIQYARHAVAIEQHPYPYTTLATLLVRQMELEPAAAEVLFLEAYELLNEALRIEDSRARHPAPHAYLVLFRGSSKLLGLGKSLSPKQRVRLLSLIDKAQGHFSRDARVISECEGLTRLLA